MIRSSDETNDLMAALDFFQARALHVPKNARNPFYESNYADLFSIKQICDPVLREAHLVITQFPGTNGGATLITRIHHLDSAQWMEAEVPLPGENAQQMGSSITYMRRYSYCAILGIVADPDDDGAASVRQSSQGRPVPNTYSGGPPVQPVPIPEYQEVNGEQIPTGYTDEPITRTGPGGVNASPVSEKQGKMLYAVTKSNYGSDADVSDIISRLLGRPVKWTNEVWVSELDGLVAKLKMRA